MGAKCLLVSLLKYSLVFYYNLIFSTINIFFITSVTYKSRMYMFSAMYIRAQDNLGKLNGRFLFSERHILIDENICLKLINQTFKYIAFYN